MPNTTIDVFSKVREGTVSFAASSGINVVEKAQAEYDALTTKDASTLYVITSLTPSS